MLRTRDPATDEDAYPEFLYMLEHADYYNKLAKIEFAYEWLAAQTNEDTIAKGRARIVELGEELEGMKG